MKNILSGFMRLFFFCVPALPLYAQTITVTDMYVYKSTDIDGDGYYETLQLDGTLFVSGGPAQIYGAVYKRNSSTIRTFVKFSAEYGVIPGVNGYSTGEFRVLEQDIYDFRIEIHQASDSAFLASMDYGQDPHLVGIKMEPANVDVTINTSAPGRPIRVDGADYSAPQTFQWPIGSQHSLSALYFQGSDVRSIFDSWSDGGAQSHTIIVPAQNTIYTAFYTTEYLLTLASAPAAGGTIIPTPATPELWYENGTQVSLQSNPALGYVFSGWSGDASGTANPFSLIMNDPKSITANFTQSFTDIATALTGVSGSSVAWGDYDNDNDLDILLIGQDNSGNALSRVYRYNGSDNFTPGVTSLRGVFNGSVAWGDYNNDGYLDILLAGDSGAERFTEIYRNNRTGEFLPISAGLPGLRGGALAWGDYDNDGDLDALLSNTAPNIFRTQIFQNNSGSFIDVNANLVEAFGGSSLAWGDYDNDGDLDILLVGDSTTEVIAKIYRNDNGSFIDISAALTGIYASAAAWGDYDNDGDLDIVIAGRAANTDKISKVYHNNGGSFGEVANLVGVENGSVAWGDYDNDGDLDILLTGTTNGSASGATSHIYRNDIGSFISIAGLFTDVYESAAAWGDYDYDGDLDVVLSGKTSSGSSVAKIYRNEVGTPNTAPSAPTNLVASQNGSSVTFSWNKATDAETSPNALTYNLRIGTTPNGNEISSPLADVATGYRRIPQLGNTNHRDRWTIKNLTGTKYYWSVQAIDHAFAGSAFAVEQISNRPPVVINVIPDTLLNAGGASFVRDLNAVPAVFNDPDGEALGYTASSADSSIATVSISGSTLTVTPVAVVNTTITVTADDGKGGIAMTTFVVSVVMGNRPPVVANTIPNDTLTVGGASFTRNLNAAPVVFNDPDGDALIYTASSSDTNIATASITGSTLMVAAVAAGKATITVTAGDGRGAITPTTFTVTVIVGNRPPTVVNVIPNQTLTVGDSSFIRDLNASPSIFNDSDGDTLTYMASSNDINVATANLVGSTLMVSPIAVGSATITVTAYDNKGGAVSTTFMVTVGIVPNRPPLVVNLILDQTLILGGTPFIRNLNASPVVFSDPDDDALSYTASSNAPGAAIAGISGSLLTVTAVGGGSATITVTANDSKGGTVSALFLVAINQRPVVANTISTQTITVGDSSFTRDLNTTPAVFNDPDGDTLAYAANSNASNIATASISGSTLTVAPVAVGNATITVTANDGRGGIVATNFTVIVMTGNRPPVVANAIPNQTLTVGSSSFTRDLNASPEVFTDPDGDALAYTANSNATNIATASISGGTLTVAPVAVGSATIVVTAGDGRGGLDSTTFAATVLVKNQPPIVLNAITDQRLRTVGATFERDLNEVFDDPDGDEMTFSAVPNAPNVAAVSVPEGSSLLTSTALAPGVATIRIFADDRVNVPVDTTFMITVNAAPNIVHTPAALHLKETNLGVAASVVDDSGLGSVQLHYRRGGDAIFTLTNMALAGNNNYQATIPPSAVTARGVEYYFVATDVDSVPGRLPETGIFSMQVQTTGETKPSAQPSGSAATAYRLISVPLQLDNTSAAAVLEDELDPYDITKWRLFGLALTTSPNLDDKRLFVEYPSAGANAFAPGQSLFLIVKEAGKVIDIAGAKSVKTDREYSITLQPGHNFVASPFNFAIPIGKLRLQSGATVSLRTYDGDWMTDAKMSPWEGYYIANNGSADVLLVNPDLSAGLSELRAVASNNAKWRIQILARCGEASDTGNFAGIGVASKNAWDESDLPEPPPIGEFVSVHFPHAEWQKPLDYYSDDMRSAAQPNHRWNFVVESNIDHEVVKLQFDGQHEIDPELAVYLVDEELNYKQSLRERASYEYQSRGLDQPKRLSLVIGKAEYVSEETANTAGVPEEFALEQNFPNPFNPETAIRFGLPEKSVVSLKIYDLSGREIATVLENIELSAGRHQRVWEGRDAQGGMVVSGIYFCRLRAGNFAQTIKLAVIR